LQTPYPDNQRDLRLEGLLTQEEQHLHEVTGANLLLVLRWLLGVYA
jgi:hypothetical protein